MNDTKALLTMFALGILFGVVLAIIIHNGMEPNTSNKSNSEVNDSCHYGIMEQFNTLNNVTGVYFPSPTFIVSLNRNSENVLNTISHEYVHHLIIQNKTCGNETCWEHFCGGHEN